jgi:arylsulfatase A-like enzyme
VIPRGFDDWFAVSFRPKVTKGSQQPHGSTALFYGYYVNANGFPRGPFGNVNYESNQNLDPSRCKMATAKVRVGSRYVRCNYLTDVIARRAVADIRNADSRPFFMQVGFDAPHSDTARPVGPQPATRHLGSASRTKLPRDPAFNEADLSDKPPLIRAAAPDPLTRREVRIVTRSYRRELESLRSVDEAIGAILNALRGTGRLRNTYVVFTSDQGKFRGEHRLSFGKFLAYEESSSVSMTVTGPGVPKDRESEEIVGNIDVPATILSLSGASTEYPVDGRSLEQYWTQPELLTRRPIGISFGFRTGTDPGAGVAVAAPALQYRAFRVGPYKYVRYLDGEHELYDLSRDPHELLNVYDHDAYAEVRAYMERHLSDVFTCQGPSCQADLPLWPMPVD